MQELRSPAKAEMLKKTITHLYSKEGRSFSYISKLLDINRQTISQKIKEWNLTPAPPKRYLSPSNQKFLNKHRNLIKSRLDHDLCLQDIAKELNISRDKLYRTFIPQDDVLKKTYQDYLNRMERTAKENLEKRKNNSSLNYDFEDLPDEHWSEILGFPGYEISDKGRARHYIKRNKTYILLKQTPNKNNSRPYVSMINKDGKRKNLMVARLVGHAFVPGFDEIHNTINHEDGDVSNSNASNLTWQSQSENNLHAYKVLHRTTNCKRRYHFDYILYQGKYQFKTIDALARFIGKSPTQVRRYLEKPEKHDIKLIQNKNCND